MSSEKINAYLGLIGDLEDKLDSINAIVLKVLPLGAEVENCSGKIPEERLMALAGYLHHFYTGIEDVLARIIKTVDGYLPGAGDWHGELLYIGSRKTPGKRPPVISADMHEILNEYKAFRHLYRHAYARELRWRKMDHLVLGMGQVWSSFQGSIRNFIVFLREVIDELDNQPETPH